MSNKIRYIIEYYDAFYDEVRDDDYALVPSGDKHILAFEDECKFNETLTKLESIDVDVIIDGIYTAELKPMFSR